jgi:hypothetical protein
MTIRLLRGVALGKETSGRRSQRQYVALEMRMEALAKDERR